MGSEEENVAMTRNARRMCEIFSETGQCLRRLTFLLLFPLLASTALLSQVIAGRVTGTVTDQTGAAIPGAHVTLTNEETSLAQKVRSGSAGTYVFEAVNPGVYTLRAKASGFKEFINPHIRVHIQTDIDVDIKLLVGSEDQKVTVTAATPLLQSQDASLGQTVDQQQVNDLPLAYRDWTVLGNLAPGVAPAAGNDFAQEQFVTFGINYTQNDFRMNGIDNNQEIYGNAPAFVPPPDAIQEFKIQTGDYSAEFGHSTAGIINAAIRSGTNNFHGDLWEYLRNTIFNANGYFNNLFDIPRSAYHQNIFGGTAGGPVYLPKIYDGRKRTFFFFDYQGTRITTPDTSNAYVPTALMRSSGFTNLQDNFTYIGGTQTDALGRVFPNATTFDPETTRAVAAGQVDPVSGFANTSSSTVYVRDPFYTKGSIRGIQNFTGLTQYMNILPASRLDPNAVALLKLFPAPTPGIIGYPNYFQFPSSPNTFNTFDVRIDQNFNNKDMIFGVYDYFNNTQYYPPSLPGIADGQSQDYVKEPRYAIALSYTHIFTPSLTNELHAGWSQEYESTTGAVPNTLGIPAQYGIGGVPQIPGNGGLPGINISNLSGMGNAGWLPTYQFIWALELMDNVTKVYGKNTFKTGVQIDKFHAPIIQPINGTGYLTYSGQYTTIPNQNQGFTGIADMLLVPGAATVPNGLNELGGLSSYGIGNYAQVSDLRYYLAAYFQDDWKVTPKLTLNLGLRWDLFTPYAEAHGRQANFIETGGGGGDSGIYYIAHSRCLTPMSPSFLSVLASSDITITCAPNDATGNYQKANFAPRVGFAYSVTPRTVVRAGFGIMYGNLDNQGFSPTLGLNYPFMYTTNFNSPNSQTPLTVGGATAVMENAFAPLNIQSPLMVPGDGISPNGRQWNFASGYQETMNLTVQHQLSSHDSVSIAYVGTFGRHLDNMGAQNAPSAMMPPGANEFDPTVEGHIPFPALGINSAFQNTDGFSSYNSMQAVYERTLSAGLSVQANYTFSRCMTDQDAAEGEDGAAGYRAQWLPGFGERADYALCGPDAKHVVHTSGIYKLPFGRGQRFVSKYGFVNQSIGGWELGVIYSYSSGQPFTVGCPIGTTADFGCNANLVPGQNPYAGPHNINQWLNPNAFANPPAATTVGQKDFSPLGSAGNQVRGPSFQQADMSLLKNFPIKESVYFQFRAEAYNLFNWTGLSNPSNLDFFNPVNFSEVTSQRGSPRVLQFALKLYY